MHNTRRVSNIVKITGIGLLAAASIAEADKLRDLWRQRKQMMDKQWYVEMFGKLPIVADGDIEKLSYDFYDEDKWAFKNAVIQAKRFLQHSFDREYEQVYGSDARAYMLKDRQKVVAGLLRAVNVPDYDAHRTIRDALRQDGILDFEFHKRQIDQHVVPRYKGNGDLETALRTIMPPLGDLAKKEKQLFLATMPIYSPDDYRRIEDEIEAIFEQSMDSWESVDNVREALDKKDWIKVAHQAKKLRGDMSDLFEQLNDLTDRSLPYRAGAMPRTVAIQPYPEKPKIFVFDYIAKEWNDLDFDRWKAKLDAVK